MDDHEGASLLLSATAQAAEIKLLASAAIRDAYLELLPQFEKTTGNKVTAEWSGTPEIQKRISVYSGGVHTGTKETDGAMALVKFLAAPAATPTITKHNLEPG